LVDYLGDISIDKSISLLFLRFVFRTFGLDGLREYIRKHIELAKYFISLISKDDRFEIVFSAVAQLGLVCFRLKSSSNEINERLLKALNDDKRIYLVPSMVKQKYILRLAICSWLTEERHVQFAWNVIDQTATELLLSK
jgi:glutamate/tyrosine decarboxylase-like PLP-dependent enzyme